MSEADLEWKFLTKLHDDLAHLYFEYPQFQQNTRLLLNQLLKKLVNQYIKGRTDQLMALHVITDFNKELNGDSRVLRFFREWKNAQKLLDDIIEKHEQEKQNA